MVDENDGKEAKSYTWTNQYFISLLIPICIYIRTSPFNLSTQNWLNTRRKLIVFLVRRADSWKLIKLSGEHQKLIWKRHQKLLAQQRNRMPFSNLFHEKKNCVPIPFFFYSILLWSIKKLSQRPGCHPIYKYLLLSTGKNLILRGT